MPRNPRNLETLQKDTIFGNEITSTARITKMNMILIGDGHSGVAQKNSLKNPVEDKYDVVITNMPYSQKTEYGSYYDLPSDNGDSICIQHCIKSIDKSSENGRMAVVVPEGFLFRKDMQKTREYLLNRCYLKSIISLPQGVFLPYTGVKANILFCTDIKKKKKQVKFWYFNVKNDGYSLDSHRRKLEGETDLQKFLAYRNIDVQEKKDVLSVGFSEISMEEVEKNDLVLSGNRYKKFFDYSKIPWEIKKMSEICEFISGYAFKSSDLKSIKEKEIYLPVIKIGNLTENGIVDINNVQYFEYNNDLERYLIQNNDILIAMTGATVGKVGISNKQNLLLNQRVGIIRTKTEKLLQSYLARLLLSENFYKYCQELALGGAQGNISGNQILNFEIPLPSTEKQQELVNELDNYQKIVDNACGLIKYYKPQINIDGKWDTILLEKIGSFQYGYTAIAKEKGDARFIRITDIDDSGKLKYDDIKYVKITKDNQQYILKKGDLLVARTGATFGKTLLFEEDNPSVFASYLIRISLDSNKVIPAYYWIYAQSEDYWKKAKVLVGGTGQPQFNANVIKNILVPIPPMEKQKELVGKIRKEQSLIEPSKKIVELFENKIQEKLNFIWGK